MSDQNQVLEKFLSREETAEFTGFSTAKITVWVRKKSFPAPYRTPNGDFLGWTKPQLFAWQRSLLEEKAA